MSVAATGAMAPTISEKPPPVGSFKEPTSDDTNSKSSDATNDDAGKEPEANGGYLV